MNEVTNNVEVLVEAIVKALEFKLIKDAYVAANGYSYVYIPFRADGGLPRVSINDFHALQNFDDTVDQIQRHARFVARKTELENIGIFPEVLGDYEFSLKSLALRVTFDDNGHAIMKKLVSAGERSYI